MKPLLRRNHILWWFWSRWFKVSPWICIPRKNSVQLFCLSRRSVPGVLSEHKQLRSSPSTEETLMIPNGLSSYSLKDVFLSPLPQIQESVYEKYSTICCQSFETVCLGSLCISHYWWSSAARGHSLLCYMWLSGWSVPWFIPTTQKVWQSTAIINLGCSRCWLETLQLWKRSPSPLVPCELDRMLFDSTGSGAHEYYLTRLKCLN